MKLFYKYILFFVMLSVIGITSISCSDDDDGGTPVIHYIRVTDPASADSLLVAALLGDLITIVGENLQGVREIWFDDQKASINPNLVTDRTILVNVPSNSPKQVTNLMTLVFSDGRRLEHSFFMAVPAPILESMKLEQVKPGETAIIRGNYFYEPIKVELANGVVVEPSSITTTEISFVVPENAVPGPITVTSNFGKTASRFHLMDDRNIILNYDDLNANGSWRPGPTASEGGLDGNYLMIKGSLKRNARVEDNFVSQFWGHLTRPEGNFFTGDPKDYVLKFEANVKEWYGSYLNIAFAPWNHSGNQEYWSNLNAKALWRPWEAEDKNYKTDGWITVTIPLSEFKYAMDLEGENVIYKEMEFDKNITGSLTFWMVGTPKGSADGSPVDVYIDNVRIVPNN